MTLVYLINLQMSEMDMETDQISLMQKMNQMNISTLQPPLANNPEQDISLVASTMTDMSLEQVFKFISLSIVNDNNWNDDLLPRLKG